jgi:hypothetical protein
LGLRLVHQGVGAAYPLVEVVRDGGLAALDGEDATDKGRGSGGASDGVHGGFKYFGLVFNALSAVTVAVAVTAVVAVAVSVGSAVSEAAASFRHL